MSKSDQPTPLGIDIFRLANKRAQRSEQRLEQADSRTFCVAPSMAFSQCAQYRLFSQANKRSHPFR